jgi:hypothetical protein
MKRLVLVVATVAIAGAESASAIYPLPDVLDCGPDTRDWLDREVDVDFPMPPPQELNGILLAAGCPASGEPTYRGPFDPDAGEPDDPGSAESRSGDVRSDGEPQPRRSARKRCNGRGRTGTKSGDRTKRPRRSAAKRCESSRRRGSTPDREGER